MFPYKGKGYSGSLEIFFIFLDLCLDRGLSSDQEDKILGFMKKNHIPYIILNRWVNDKFTNYINVDDTLAAYNATLYLISNGHRKIAFVGGNENFRNSKLRVKGYTQALEDNGIIVRDEYIRQGYYTERYGYQMADDLMELEDKPTAVLFSSDMIAIGFLNHIRELGLNVPKRLLHHRMGRFSRFLLRHPSIDHNPHSQCGVGSTSSKNAHQFDGYKRPYAVPSPDGCQPYSASISGTMQNPG